MDPALLATLRMHNPWLDRPADQAALLAASLPELFIARHRRLELRPGRAELVVAAPDDLVFAIEGGRGGPRLPQADRKGSRAIAA